MLPLSSGNLVEPIWFFSALAPSRFANTDFSARLIDNLNSLATKAERRPTEFHFRLFTNSRVLCSFAVYDNMFAIKENDPLIELVVFQLN